MEITLSGGPVSFMDAQAMADEETLSSGWHGGEAGRAGSSDAVNRQLRRRYELLRDDYDELLDRLTEVEGRLRRTEQTSPETPAARGLSAAISDAISAPLFALRDEYTRAAEELTALADAIEQLGWRSLKGQRGSTAPERESTSDVERDQARTTVEVQVDSGDLGALLDFQEQVAQLSCVARVSLSQVRDDRATLTVELR